MFATSTFLVLLVIFETTVCQIGNLPLKPKFRRPNLTQNATDKIIEMNKSEVDDIIRTIFSVTDSGLVLFNTTHNTNDSVVEDSELQNDEAFNQKQEFKVQRNSDGNLDIVFNDVSFPQKSVQQRRTPNASSPQKDIYFPDEIEIDPICKRDGNSLCTKVDNYPEEELENILKNQLLKLDVLFNDYDDKQPVNISQRMSPGEESLCASEEKVVYPKAGESKDSKWLYIVNHPNATQGVKIEQCVNEGSKCTFAEYFPNGYTAKCKQKFIYRKLVAVKNGKLETDFFKIPSCCQCIYKQE